MRNVPEDDPRVSLRAATLEDMSVLQRMYSAHLAVLAASNPGVNLSARLQTDWVEKPDKLAAWFIQLDEPSPREVGFALICGRAYARALGSPADYLVYEFFIEENARGQGVGRAALRVLFNRSPGTWGLDVLPGNTPAMAFWDVTLAAYESEAREHVENDGVTFVRHLFHVPSGRN